MGMTDRVTQRAAENGSAKGILFELQVEQHHHDEAYHREIARLSLHQRLNHMALHFAKYAGKVATLTRPADATSVYVDTLIIGLSTANILNIDVWEVLGHGTQEYPGLLAFGRALALRHESAMQDHLELLRETIIASGRIAAACEKIDHLEEIPFRAEIKLGLAKLLTLSLAVIASQGVDPATAVCARLSEVKKRLRLHGRF